MNETKIEVSGKLEAVKKNAMKAAKYVGVAASGAVIGAGVMYAITHGHADKVISAAAVVADQAPEVIPEVVEAAI